jgi:hypothetical protein
MDSLFLRKRQQQNSLPDLVKGKRIASTFFQLAVSITPPIFKITTTFLP